MGSTLLHLQPSLVHVPIVKDMVYTPLKLSAAIINHFQPSGLCLDPCLGDGAFYNFLPEQSREWCEIQQGHDFLAYTTPVDWCVGNPPYSHLLAWIRYSFTVAKNVVYLLPLHRVMASAAFLEDVATYGGLKEILYLGTGTDAGFPFGHALTAVHYQRDWSGGTTWSVLKNDWKI